MLNFSFNALNLQPLNLASSNGPHIPLKPTSAFAAIVGCCFLSLGDELAY
jgi:hypothetical protein